MANTLPILTKGGTQNGEVSLPDGLFGIEPNEHVMHEAVRTYLANQRSGTAASKGRSDVRGGGRKPWRQKGTGRARIGSTRVSHWVGGGLAFGPQPRAFTGKLPRKIRRLALKSALSSKAAAGNLVILDEAKSDGKTAALAKQVKDLGWKKALVIDGASVDENFAQAARNLAGIDVRMITGDHAVTAAAIGRELGLGPGTITGP
mgnify:CR=1 FL=1